MEEKLQKVAEDFLKMIQGKLPTEKADKPFIVGIVGMIGSGRTLLAKTLVDNLKGAVLNCEQRKICFKRSRNVVGRECLCGSV
ncbi:MAG: hypothetical protein A2V60_01965 [Candidatus Portnoybacteria bacterium RIFCSPHIGHO2_01_FULL_39_19]|nr:MAG: hypothetical protein A2V60_01965 [Candidatus Portnoybacteria bacterium RIFCSPHIGHO2_01_FULL_39_19]